MRKPLWFLWGSLMGLGCLFLHIHAQGRTPELSRQANTGEVTPPANWQKVDAGPFSIFAPPGWQFHQLQGVDSYIGEFIGDGFVLSFDYGLHSNPLKDRKKPAYSVVHKSIGGRREKIVSPKTPGHGLTGLYFHNVGDSAALTLFGRDLTPTQQELGLKIFDTLRFGGPPPRYVLPPQPTKNTQ